VGQGMLEMRAAVTEVTVRVTRLASAIAEHAPTSASAPLIADLQALRGLRLLGAATLATELGDLQRFARPRQLMGYVGPVHSEHSSGAPVCRGRLTKTGNGHARRVPVEAAWSCRFPPRMGADQQRRSACLSPEGCATQHAHP